MRDRHRPPTARGTSVKEDWRAWLPEEKDKVFGFYVQQLESYYTMLSVTLDEAMGLRQTGRLGKSSLTLEVAPALCERLTDWLFSIQRALAEHAQHYGIVPNAAPLDPANFKSPRGQRGARMSNLLSHVLLSQRAQFLHKLSTLQELTEDLGRSFRETAAELAEGPSIEPDRLWETADFDHYDMNTCLRETVVLLKSFFLVLPDDQLAAFQQTVGSNSRKKVQSPSKPFVIRHRRIAQIVGE